MTQKCWLCIGTPSAYFSIICFFNTPWWFCINFMTNYIYDFRFIVMTKQGARQSIWYGFIYVIIFRKWRFDKVFLIFSKNRIFRKNHFNSLRFWNLMCYSTYAWYHNYNNQIYTYYNFLIKFHFHSPRLKFSIINGSISIFFIDILYVQLSWTNITL